MLKEYKQFFDRIDEIQTQLNKQKEFIHNSLLDPSLLFSNAAQVFGSTRSTIFQIMNIYEDNQRKMNTHEFQSFLSETINSYFKVYFNNSEILVKVRNEQSFPSLFAVYLRDVELIQFNIFDKFYGMRNHSTEEIIEEEYKKKLENHNSIVANYRDKLTDMQEAKSNPYLYIYNHHIKSESSIAKKTYYLSKDLIHIFLSNKKIMSGIEKVIEKHERSIKSEENTYMKYNNYEKDMETLKLRNKMYSIIEPIFVEHGYRLENESYKLY